MPKYIFRYPNKHLACVYPARFFLCVCVSHHSRGMHCNDFCIYLRYNGTRWHPSLVVLKEPKKSCPFQNS